MSSETQPSVPQTGAEIRIRIVGTPTNSDVDTDAEEAVTHEVDFLDQPIPGNEDLENRLAENKASLNDQLANAIELGEPGYRSAKVVIQTTDKTTHDGVTVVTILKPTASKFTHEILNPYVYRELEPVPSLDHLADLVEAPVDWENTYNTKILSDARILTMLKRLTCLPSDKEEADIEAAFQDLIIAVLYILNVRCYTERATKVFVGGILALDEYDIKSKPDVHFSLYDTDKVLLATEIKSSHKFPDNQYWYCGSRGIQVLSSLYAFNCPTFLFSQDRWKLFVENKERNQILTSPYGMEQSQPKARNSSCFGEMGTGTNFLAAVVICLLSGQRHSKLPIVAEPTAVYPVGSSSRQHQQMKTPQKTKNPRGSSGGEPQTRPRSKRFRVSQDESSPVSTVSLGPITPSFVSGYVDGNPIYTPVRVWTREEVQQKEAEMEIIESKHATATLARTDTEATLTDF